MDRPIQRAIHLLPPPNYNEVQGSVSFNVTMKLTTLVTVSRTQYLTVESASASSPYFGCSSLCNVEFGSSVLLPDPPDTSISGDGVLIMFKNGAILGTANSDGDLVISADGSFITCSSNSSDAWSADNTTLDEDFFEWLGIEAYDVTSASWYFFHTSH